MTKARPATTALEVAKNLDLATADLELLSDEALYAAYRECQDKPIFEELVGRYKDEIYSYLCRYLDNAQMAEDAFQGTILTIHTRRETFDTSKRFRPWLYAVATNQAIDLQRRNKRHRMASLDAELPGGDTDNDRRWSEKIVGDLPDPLEEAARSEQASWVSDSVASLGDSLQTVVHLVYYQGMKYREAAEVLGIPVGTVKSRLHAAVHRLAAIWDESRDPDSQ